VSIRFTAIRLPAGTMHQHIVRLWWTNPSSSETGDNSRAELVAWIEQDGKAYVEDRFGNRVDVGVVTPRVGEDCLRTHADGKWTDNLLALPRKWACRVGDRLPTSVPDNRVPRPRSSAIPVDATT